jgi:hypothetical protein
LIGAEARRSNNEQFVVVEWIHVLDTYAAWWVILEHGNSSHIEAVVAIDLHWIEKKLGCCSNNFAAFLKKTYSVTSSIMWSLCKTRRCKRMEKSTPDLVADQQSLQGAVHFLLWKTLVAQMCRDPAKICTHPKKHHLAQCQSMFKRTLESTTSTKTCTCIPAGLNCNTDQTFKLFTQKPPEHHNGYVFLFFATTRIKHQWNQLRPMFLLFATRIKHQQNQFRPRVFVFFSNNKNQTSMQPIYTHVFVFFQFSQQESNINRSNWGPCFCSFATTRIKHQPKQLRPMFLFFCNNKNQTSTV